MQVSHQEDHVTHAVIGSRKSIDFGISDSADFFQILSSTLYKNSELAMIRETICNAWDAHIDAGRTDLPVVITLADGYLTIQDSGKGIPDELIGPVYAVYGASTKKKDSKSTGGFGLGCKAPFAYTDHFEVTSCFEGKRTIYNMSKSSAEMDGKPSVNTIASFPITNGATGITVKIPLKNNGVHMLEYLIKQVVFNGDIFATLNGETIETIRLDQTEFGFLLIEGDNHPENAEQITEATINVRYGAVIYPVDYHASYDDLFKKVDHLCNLGNEKHVVLQAPPDSLTIIPSREALKYSEMSVETIRGLLQHFLAHFNHNSVVKSKAKKLIYARIDDAANSERSAFYKLQLGSWTIPGLVLLSSQNSYRTTDDFAQLNLNYTLSRQSYTRGQKDWSVRLTHYVNALIKNNTVERGLAQSWLRTWQKHYKKFNKEGYNGEYQNQVTTRWFKSVIMKRVMRALKNVDPTFELHKLTYSSDNASSPHDMNGWRWSTRRADAGISMRHLMLNSFCSAAVHLVKPKVVLCHNPDIILRRMREDGSPNVHQEPLFFYHIPKLKAEAMPGFIKLFQEQTGIEVIDMTGRTRTEQVRYELEVARRQAANAKRKATLASKPKVIRKQRPGLILLDQMLEADGEFNSTLFSTLLEPERSTTPEFVAKISTSVHFKSKIPGFSVAGSKAIAALYGKQGVVTNNEAVFKKQVKGGVMEMADFVVKKLVDEITNSTTIKQYAGYMQTKLDGKVNAYSDYYQEQRMHAIIRLIHRKYNLADFVPSAPVLSADDHLRLVVWTDLTTTYPQRNLPEVVALETELNAVPLHPDAVAFIETQMGNKCLEIIDFDKLKEQMFSDDVAIANKADAIFKMIL